MTDRGVTLVELLVVIAIVAILAIALGFSYVGWQGAYKVEKVTKDIYTDLMDARSRAMGQGRMYFADFNFPSPPIGGGTYRLAEGADGVTDGDADGDGVIDSPPHTILNSFPKTVDFPISLSATSIITFNKWGIIDPTDQTICLSTTAIPDYDCIEVSQTRITMGKLKTQISAGGLCDATNCVAK